MAEWRASQYHICVWCRHVGGGKGKYAANLEKLLRSAKENAGDKMPLVCGEGVSYICSKKILWEENSEEYWRFVKEGLDLYKKAGVWGTVIRTCCGPEDPCWELCADKLLELNRFFLDAWHQLLRLQKEKLQTLKLQFVLRSKEPRGNCLGVLCYSS